MLFALYPAIQNLEMKFSAILALSWVVPVSQFARRPSQGKSPTNELPFSFGEGILITALSAERIDWQ